MVEAVESLLLYSDRLRCISISLGVKKTAENGRGHSRDPFLHFWAALCGLCGLTVERSLAILKVAGSNLGRSASR